MRLTAAERLILLKLAQVLEIIDPANARQHDADAQALELGTPACIASLFQHIDLAPVDGPIRVAAPLLRLVSAADKARRAGLRCDLAKLASHLANQDSPRAIHRDV